MHKCDLFTKTGSGQTQGKHSKTTVVFLGKTSIGNTDQFGSVTYVLNARELAGRSFWEPVDGGT